MSFFTLELRVDRGATATIAVARTIDRNTLFDWRVSSG